MEFNKPNPFKPNKSQIGKDWQIWKREFFIYLRLSGCYEKCTEEERALILLNLMGTEGVRAMEEMTFNDPDEKDDMDILIEKFDQIFDPPLNETEERYKFFSRRIRANENIDNYVSDLKIRASTCNFGSQAEKFIIDMVVRDMDSYIRDVVFALGDVSLSEVIQYYKQFNINNDKIKELTRNAVASKPKTLKATDNSNNTQGKSMEPKFCWKCSSRHIYGVCPAYGNICNVCNHRNHLNGVCQKQTMNNKKDCVKSVCLKCGTYHAFKSCPVDDNDKEKIKRICSKCGTNHPYKQCPAFDKTCEKCSIKGHYTQQCKEEKTDDAVKSCTDTSRSTDNKAEAVSDTILEDCSWCELKHVKDHCPHPAKCVRCTVFPHNVCFKCKKNPHDFNCHFKAVITLASKTSSNNKSDKQNCTNCGTNHGNSPCNPFILYCNKCKSQGHLTHTCASSIERQSNRAQSSISDPLLSDYVSVENAQLRSLSSANNQNPTPSSSTFNTNYVNNVNHHNPTVPRRSTSDKNVSHKSKSDFRKQNGKPNECTVS